MGYIYTLNRVSDNLLFWLCDKRGTCRARIHTSNDIIVKLVIVSEIHQNSYTFALTRSCTGAEELYKMKEIASNSEQSSRGILSIVLGEMNPLL